MKFDFALALMLNLGVPEHVALDLLTYAVQLNGSAGVDRVLLAILDWAGRQQVAAERDALAEAQRRIDVLTAELARRHREEERGNVLPLTPCRRP